MFEMSLISKNEWKMGWLASRRIHCPCGNTRVICCSKFPHESAPRLLTGKSSTIRNPPFDKYDRSAVASGSPRDQYPGSHQYATGNLNSSGSLNDMMLLSSM